MEEVQAPDLPPVRLACRVAYLGDRFYGSQMQAEERTVEGEFVAACIRIGLFSDHREAGFSAAGRTDRGVHARGQVFAFSTPYPSRALSALNWQLPLDCWISGYANVEAGFHPRYDAKLRTYRYYFGTTNLDVKAMDSAARLFVGTHDFSVFSRSSERNPERTITSARVWCEGGTCIFEVTGDSFLWNMVRLMAAALRRIGQGKEGEEGIVLRLEGERFSPLSPLPPNSLILWNVDCGISFHPLPVEGKRQVFLARLHEHHTALERVVHDLNEGNK
ncbi:MAG: tRNA pseudouridine(38-40) synthase TruA [Methanoregulaceae archaeon]|nr:tRNA pseudouridine(38-40) synthase TruA [Methanoregulaceae archaeon]